MRGEGSVQGVRGEARSRHVRSPGPSQGVRAEARSRDVRPDSPSRGVPGGEPGRRLAAEDLSRGVRGAPGSSRPPRITRRHLQLVLAGLWLLEAALQLQPFMFTTGFARQVVEPMAGGQPGLVALPLHLAARLIAAQPVLANAVFAGVQLAIAAGLLIRRAAKGALALSILWGLGVWYLGEGLGGIIGGHTSLLAGAPGGALLNVALALLAWPARQHVAATPERGSLVAGAAPGASGARTLTLPLSFRHTIGGDRRVERLRTWLGSGTSDVPPSLAAVVAAWCVVWVLGAVLRVLPAQAAPASVAAVLNADAHGSPSWLAAWDHSVAAWALARSWVVPGLVVLQLSVAALAIRRGVLRTAAALVGTAMALAQWVLGQGMGQLTSGQTTDPNAGIVLAILGLVLVTCSRAAPRSARATAPARPAPAAVRARAA